MRHYSHGTLERQINVIVNSAMFHENTTPILDAVEGMDHDWDSQVEVYEEVDYRFGERRR